MNMSSDIDYNKKSKRGESYLSLACYWDYKEIVKLLLEQKSIVDDVNSGLSLSLSLLSIIIIIILLIIITISK